MRSNEATVYAANSGRRARRADDESKEHSTHFVFVFVGDRVFSIARRSGHALIVFDYSTFYCFVSFIKGIIIVSTSLYSALHTFLFSLSLFSFFLRASFLPLCAPQSYIENLLLSMATKSRKENDLECSEFGRCYRFTRVNFWNLFSRLGKRIYEPIHLALSQIFRSSIDRRVCYIEEREIKRINWLTKWQIYACRMMNWCIDLHVSEFA